VTADAGKGSTAALRADALLLLEDLENFEKLDAGESTIKLNWPTFARGASAVEWTGDLVLNVVAVEHLCRFFLGEVSRGKIVCETWSGLSFY
jgi:hypothetical protein